MPNRPRPRSPRHISWIPSRSCFRWQKRKGSRIKLRNGYILRAVGLRRCAPPRRACLGGSIRRSTGGRLRRPQLIETCLSDGLTLAHVAALHSASEILHPLLSRSVRKRLRHDVTLRAFLDHIVADRRCRRKSFFGVTGFEQSLFLRVISPNAGIAVRLQF